MYNQPVQLLDSDADNKVADADLALQELGGDHVAFGYLTTTDHRRGPAIRAAAEEKVRAVERVVNGLGFTAKRERHERGRGVAVEPSRARSMPMSASRSSTPSILRI